MNTRLSLNKPDNITDAKIAVIGLGYVGLPLFCLFSRVFSCVGFDENKRRVEELNKGTDSRECEKRRNIQFALSNSVITSDQRELKGCSIFIVCVPTGVSNDHKPELSPLKKACRSIGQNLKKNDMVIFESTVFPGATENLCVPILEEHSHLTCNEDFSVGYSPERINVGDKAHHLAMTSKIISASNPQALELMERLYSSVISAPINVASNIKIAEAAKMYENVQRDVLIALANEMSDYCHAEGIDIKEVTECASSKWNFSNVTPGLVGGHCIGVDPYYLLARAKDIHIELPLVSIAREINESKVQTVADRIKAYALSLNKPLREVSILVLGVSYKPDTPDIRNSKAIELIKLLKSDVGRVDCFDPLVDKSSLFRNQDISVFSSLSAGKWEDYDIIIEAVPHKCFHKYHEMGSSFINLSDII